MKYVGENAADCQFMHVFLQKK